MKSRLTVRLEVGYPHHPHEVRDDLTPLDSGLMWAVRKPESGYVHKFIG